jgi:O-antigen/teichoic acid export membrane protein
VAARREAPADLPRRSLLSIALIGSGALLSALLAFVTQVVLARGYGIESVGHLVTAMAISNLAVPLALMGTHWFALDARVRDDPRRWLGAIRRVFAISAALACAGSAASALAFGLPVAAAVATAGMVACVAATERAIAAFQVAQSFGRVALAQPVSYALRAIAVGAAALAGAGAGALWAGVALGQLVAAAALLGWATAVSSADPGRVAVPDGPGRPASGPALPELARELAPLVGIAFVAICFTQVDRLVVSALQGAASAGLYGTAASVLLIAEILPGAAASRFLLARVSALGDDPQARRGLALRAGAIALAAGLAAAAVAAAIGPWVVVTLFGPEFEASGEVLRTLAWYLPGRYLAMTLAPFCIGRGLKHAKLVLDAVALALFVPALWATAGGGSPLSVAALRAAAETILAVAIAVLLARGLRGDGANARV